MKILKKAVLFAIGGLIYVLIEIGFRGYSHPAMFFVGGLCFILVGDLNNVLPWEMAFWKQMLAGGTIITLVEFLSGVVLNLILGLHIWDYSNMPLNVLGQICLPFSLAWILLSAVAIVLDDYLRYWLFGEEKPHYKWR
jgi:uncharacterized membrane protein